MPSCARLCQAAQGCIAAFVHHTRTTYRHLLHDGTLLLHAMGKLGEGLILLGLALLQHRS